MKKTWLHCPIILVALAAAGFGALPLAAASCDSSALNPGNIIPGLTAYPDSATVCLNMGEHALPVILDTAELVNLYTPSTTTGGISQVVTVFDSASSQIVDQGGGDCTVCGDILTGENAGFPDSSGVASSSGLASYSWASYSAQSLASAISFVASDNSAEFTGNVDPHRTPEPGTWLMGLSGVLIMWLMLRRRNDRSGN